MKQFQEFLKEKVTPMLMADLTAKTPLKPPKNGVYSNEQPENTGVIPPYSNPSEDSGVVMAEPDGKSSLGDAKTPGMDPEKAVPDGKKPPRPKVHKPARKQLKEFYEATKSLSDAAFVSYLMERKGERAPVAMVHDLHGDPFTPHPHEAMSFICSLMHNDRMVSRLIREAKRQGHLGTLVAELMDHPEFYDEAVKMMADKDEGKRITDKFARTMFDHHSSFKKEAGLAENKRRKGKLLTEKVGPALVDDDFSMEDIGMPSPDDQPREENPSQNPDEMPEMNPDEMGQMGGDMGQEDPNQDFNLSDDDGGEGLESPKGTHTPASQNMLGSIKGQYGEDGFNQLCKDC